MKSIGNRQKPGWLPKRRPVKWPLLSPEVRKLTWPKKKKKDVKDSRKSAS
ncbi:MAG: hypothetical protein H5U07_09435 [Candidatus Aminicenantes bacterium]|nr:hypothetical protein [Candidatus Aminicenantes bacterium]